MPPTWLAVRVKNSLNKGPFFRKFPLNIARFSRNWQKLSKMGTFLPEFIMKVGMAGPPTTGGQGGHGPSTFLQKKCNSEIC